MDLNRHITPDEREENLPKWARDSLRFLRQDLLSTMNENVGLRDGKEVSPFRLERLGDASPHFYLPTTGLLQLVFEPPGRPERSLAIKSGQNDALNSISDEWLEIRATGRADHVIVAPAVSNAVRIKAVRSSELK